jgi:chromosomal replication initiator protein
MKTHLYNKNNISEKTASTIDSSYIWTQFMILIEKELGKNIIDGWFRTLSFIHLDRITETIVIKCPNKFVKDWIEQNYVELMQKIFSRVLNLKIVLIKLFIDDLSENEKKIFSPAIKINNKTESKLGLKIKLKDYLEKINLKASSLNSNFTFENFIVGPGNDVAYAASKYLVENENVWYNSLFISGNSGMGKTHIIQAIAKALHDKNTIYLYQTADRFIQDYVNAVRANNIDQFERAFEKIDVLLIDDIQFFAKKKQTEEIFIKIFNSLIQQEKRIVISGNTHPKNIAGLSDRIKSRLEGGLITDLTYPSFKTMNEILKIKTRIHNINISDEIINYIVSNSSGSIREAEGFLIRIIAYSSLTKKEPNMEIVFDVINEKKEILNIYSDPYSNIIINIIAQEFGISSSDVCSKKRDKKILKARYFTIYLLRTYLNKSYNEIKKYFNYKDHTTIIYAYKKIKEIKELKSKELLNIEEIIVSNKAIEEIYKNKKDIIG